MTLPISFQSHSLPQVEGYSVLEQLYLGPRTAVYRAVQTAQQRSVVIKVLRREYPSFCELVQFHNQYAIANSLPIPGIVRPLGIEPLGSGYALIMEDVGGISLGEYIEQQPLGLPEVLAIALQMADILHDLYEYRVIHKDIKPANILINPNTRQIKLIDFSIASLLFRETREIQHPNRLEGTLAYMSPEQTGRMNRGVDYRTDFYSFGVTLYELLTGQVPFQSDDLMELLHCHLAKQPMPLDQINPHDSLSNIPTAVSNIVLKLMAKNAEDRYQSALGLKHDLVTCLHAWESTGAIASFTLGRRDLCDRFVIPEKLYGRQAEVTELLTAFKRVAQSAAASHCELVLVAGFSGIGKTALVNEVHKPIVRQRGYFIKGKYDQFQRNIPFSALVQALRDLMGQILSDSDAQLQQWRSRILTALGENGQVLIDVIPELGQIIGHQPPVPDLKGIAAQNRFNLLFQTFIQALTTPEHPLVMFLDDLQWADSASLTLIKLLLTEASLSHLLLIGAYRDNEVSPGHPLMLMLDEVDPAIAHTLTLGPLLPQDMNDLVAETLSCSVEIALPLAQLVYQKTAGNPFFTNQFLKALHSDGLIVFNRELGYWECDLAQIKPLAISEDVAAFMAQQLQKLPLATQTALQLAACIGNQFDLATLAIAADQPQSEVAIALWQALQQELVLPRSDIYKFYQAQERSQTHYALLHRPPDMVSYRFLHDRVQQAAYRLIPDADKPATHLNIGQRLRQLIPVAKQDDYLFAIVNQLNLGAALITDAAELADLAILNLSAGKKAKNCTAYRAAMDYANRGIRCLSVCAWQEQYDLALSLYGLATEVAYLCGDFQQMEVFAQAVVQHANCLFDQIEVYNVQILTYTAANQPLEAVELGLGILRQLGAALPESPTDADIQQTLSTVMALHPLQGIASLIDLPRMSDRNALAALQILNAIFTPCYAVAPKLIPLILAIGAKLSMTYGSAPLSAIAYAGYGMLLCGVVNDLTAGYEFGQLALNLLPRFSEAAIQTRVMCMVAAFVLHWRNPLRETISTLQMAFQSGMETGDLQYTAWSYYHDCQGSYLSGQELASLDRKLTHYEQALTQIKQDFQRDRSEMLHQVVLNLLGQSRTPHQIVGSIYDETLSQQQYHTTNNTEALYFLHFHRLLLCYWFGRIEQAWEESIEAEHYLTSVPAQAVVPVFYLYDSLVRLAHYDQVSASDQPRVMERVQANQARLAYWKTFAPHNYQHKFDLVEAEMARVSGQKSLAIDAYDRAIAGARAQGYYQEEGLANELAAQFYLAWNKTIIAQSYLIDAYYCYGRWGAKAKVDDLERRYPRLLAPILNQLTDLTDVTATHTLPASGRKSSPLDLMSVMKASQILSSEIEQPNLLTTLLQVMLENAGADRGAILLPQAEQLDVVVQGGSQEPFDLTPIALETLANLPLSLIRAAQRTQTATIVNDVATNPALAADPYLSTQVPKSLLCLPIVRQGQLVAILYLENRLMTGAFTADRLQVLNLLCTQAAISLENAHLYQQAQNYSQQLECSLRELQQTQLQLVQSEKMSALGNLVAGIAHEINNPVGFLAGNLNPARTYIKGLLGLIERYQQQFPNPGWEIEQEIAMIDLDFVRDDLPKLIGSMQLGIERIKSISTSLRAFSRADAEYKVNANLHEGIDSALLILKYRLQANQHRPEIKVLKEYGELPLIKCFPGQLNQVFMNILANAIDMFDEMAQTQSFKAIALNPQKIMIQTAVVERQVQILIRDNGKGMSEDVKEKIFDYLFTTKAVGKGTGLGLALTHQIVTEKHYGSLEVQSELGQGTEFCIRLPISS